MLNICCTQFTSPCLLVVLFIQLSDSQRNLDVPHTLVDLVKVEGVQEVLCSFAGLVLKPLELLVPEPLQSLERGLGQRQFLLLFLPL